KALGHRHVRSGWNAGLQGVERHLRDLAQPDLHPWVEFVDERSGELHRVSPELELVLEARHDHQSGLDELQRRRVAGTRAQAEKGGHWAAFLVWGPLREGSGRDGSMTTKGTYSLLRAPDPRSRTEGRSSDASQPRTPGVDRRRSASRNGIRRARGGRRRE